jgi:bifunctional polynucleotide phosphatase/kinase
VLESAVASFFTPTSQKPPERTTWSERGPNEDSHATLLVGKYVPVTGAALPAASKIERRRKVAAFDFVSCT